MENQTYVAYYMQFLSTRLYNFINDTLVAESTVKLLYAFCAVF